MANLEVISPDTVPGSVCYVFIGPTIVSTFFEIMVHFQLLRSKTNKFEAQSQSGAVWCKAQPA